MELELTYQEYDRMVDEFCDIYNTTRKLIKEKYPYIDVEYKSYSEDKIVPAETLRGFMDLVIDSLSAVTAIFIKDKNNYDDLRWQDILEKYLVSARGIVSPKTAMWEMAEPVDVEIQMIYKKIRLKNLLDKCKCYMYPQEETC